MAAVLAGIAIALEDVVPRELDLLAGESIEEEEQDDSRDTDAKRDRADMRFSGRSLGDVLPFLEAVGLKRSVLMAEDDLRMAFEEQGHSPAD